MSASQQRLVATADRTMIWVTAAVVLAQIAEAAAIAGAWGVVAVTGGLTLLSLARSVLMSIEQGSPPVDLGPPSEISRLSEPDFDLLEDAVERSVARPNAELRLTSPGPDFESLVREALDELPGFVQEMLADNLAVLVSDDGRTRGAHGYYGLYVGSTAADVDYNHRVHIFRDMLMGDFGHDPEELRRQVRITVRHEIAHHLGADERHVEGLGL